MIVSSLRAGYMATLQTGYMLTTKSCIQFYYWITAENDQPVLSVFTVSEDSLTYYTVGQSSQTTLPGWNIFNGSLPDGINQIQITGFRNDVGANGLAIDDIIVQSCDLFSECCKNRMLNTLLRYGLSSFVTLFVIFVSRKLKDRI